MSVIEVNNLTKDYGFGRGVFDVSFKIEKGEVFGFLGPNGAGKSTTIRHIMGFSKPDKGSTKIFGQETFKHYDKILNKVGYIPGEIALPQGLTGWEFIHMMQDLQHIHNVVQLDKLLNMFKLDDIVLNSETKRMSLGVKRKLAIVVAFMNDPEVLILDEPTSGLDPVMQQVFIDYIKYEKEHGKTILLSSHIFSEVDATCDRIAIIKDGRVINEFLANELKHKADKFYEITFDGVKDYQKFIELKICQNEIKIVHYNKKSNSVLIMVNDKDINELIGLLSDYHVNNFSNIKETLEDYFMKFYKEDKDFGGIKWKK